MFRRAAAEGTASQHPTSSASPPDFGPAEAASADLQTAPSCPCVTDKGNRRRDPSHPLAAVAAGGPQASRAIPPSAARRLKVTSFRQAARQARLHRLLSVGLLWRTPLVPMSLIISSLPSGIRNLSEIMTFTTHNDKNRNAETLFPSVCHAHLKSSGFELVCS